MGPLSRHRSRGTVAVLAFAAGLVLLATAFAAEVDRKRFNLPGDVAEKSLKKFSEQAGLEVLFPTAAVKGIRTNAVRGEMTATEALRAMLSGTELVAVADERGGVTVRRERAPVGAEKPGQTAPPAPASNASPDSKKKQPLTAENQEPMKRNSLLSSLAAAFALVSAPASPAAEAGAGTITGRVFNPATGEYVRNAEVRLEGTNRIAPTESDGSFTFNHVPAGPATLSVTYTGYQTATEQVTVVPGQTATREIDLTRSDAGTPKIGDTILLRAFTVSSDREGNAKAIMEQRRNMNISTSVASDIFGDVTDGNVGEFLKFLPGVDVDYIESETRGPRLGGMDAQYVGVSFDGVRVASADSSLTGDLGRATSFEAFSISSIESIEISRTTSPDMDADSPAGTVNLKTRRAFDRKGRHLRYNLSLNLNSEEFHLKKTYGPGGGKEYKARPNYSLEYSDVFLDRRLGLVASFSHVDSYTEQYRHDMTHSRTPTAADPRPMVVTRLTFKDGNKNIEKDTYSLMMDFKATPRLVLSNTFIYNYALGQFFNRNIVFTGANNNTSATNGRSTILGDGLNQVRTSANGVSTVATSGGSASKRTHTVTLAPKFEYKLGALTVEGWGAYSRSRNNNEAIEKGHVRVEATNAIASQFTATRSSETSYEWTVQQTAGPDWFNLANFVNPRVGNEGIYARTEIYSGALNAQWAMPVKRFPTVLKFGGKWNEESRKNGEESDAYNWSYIGPGGNTLTGFNPTTGVPILSPTGTFAAFPNRNFWSSGRTNMLTVKDLNGQYRPESIPRADPNAIAAVFTSHPEYFVNTATPDNYYDAFIGTKRDIRQVVTAGYGMADVRLSDKVQVRTGLRWEKTLNIAKEFNPKTNRQVVAAGFPVNAAGRATTVPGINYQYFSNPRVEREKEYDNFFPMLSVKYSIARNLQFHTGFNKAISRPPIDSLTGAWIVNEELQRVTGPNPNLLPEYSKNFAARLAYYFNPAGQLSVTVTQNTIRNLRETRRGTAEEFGVGDDPQYAAYEFDAPFNVANPRRHRSMEIGYSQSLPFQHELLRGTTLNLAYTRSYADARRNNLLPHRFTSQLGYSYKRFRGRAGVVWRDSTPELDYGRYRRHDAKLDLGGEFVLTRHASLFFQGRNVFNDGQTWMETPAGVVEGQGAAIRRSENYGANWNFGVKGTF